jgi:hypothetical protein
MFGVCKQGVGSVGKQLEFDNNQPKILPVDARFYNQYFGELSFCNPFDLLSQAGNFHLA